MTQVGPAIRTAFTDMFGIRYPIIGAPMFLVSNVEMVVAISEAGGLGTFPSLNFRPIEQYRAALQEIRRRTNKPWGVNIIVNKSNTRQGEDLRHALDAGTPLFITSLGNPAQVIREAHDNGARVFCDVTNLTHALKVADQGADGLIAVASGAGGHAGPISPFILVPWLKEKVSIPVVASGGIATGQAIAAALALGASAAYIGTRFIASTESGAAPEYKQAILNATPEDIVMTTRLSGHPASVIRTPYVESLGRREPILLRVARSRPALRRLVTKMIHLLRVNKLETEAVRPTWKTVWSAGQSAGLVLHETDCAQIVDELVQQYHETVAGLPGKE